MCADSAPPLGRGVLAYAPTFPLERKERWYLILADPLSNSVYGAPCPPRHDRCGAYLRAAISRSCPRVGPHSDIMPLFTGVIAGL